MDVEGIKSAEYNLPPDFLGADEDLFYNLFDVDTTLLNWDLESDEISSTIGSNYRDKGSGKKALLEEDTDDDEDNYDSQRWRNEPIELWNEVDTKNWLYSASKEIGQLYRDISPKLVVSGEDLLVLSREDFFRHDPRFGGQLYDALKELKELLWPHDYPNRLLNVPDFTLDLKLEGGTPCESDSSSSGKESAEKPESPKRGPGRPRTTGKKTKEAKPKIWEFIRNLLLDERYCPGLIRWENYEEKTFIFVDSQNVAQLWGDRRDNKNMNFEKFSRLMRFYYKKKLLEPVPDRRLVYKFGPNATGLETDNPNFALEDTPSAVKSTDLFKRHS